MNADLATILSRIDEDLDRATRHTDPPHPWRWGTLSTVGLDGAPQARTMVLRAADVMQGHLLMHTDVRSPKWAELTRHPRAAWTALHPATRTQLRASGCASLHRDDPIAERVWESAPPPTLAIYFDGEVPGDRDDPSWAEARARFGVVRLEIEGLDWLELGPTRHLRARFAKGPEGWSGGWVSP